jgi:hypothetical protein
MPLPGFRNTRYDSPLKKCRYFGAKKGIESCALAREVQHVCRW